MPSLYANLLDPSTAPGTISSAPVKYEFKKAEETSQEEKKPDASLRFQPIKRPTVTQKSKPKGTNNAGLIAAKAAEKVISNPITQHHNNTIDKWKTNDDEYDEDPFAAEYNRRMDEEKRRKRGGRKKNKNRNKDSKYVDWDRVYDPERPTRLEDYQGSEEQVQATHDWKMRLHAHQFRERYGRAYQSSDEDEEEIKQPRMAFAPPNNYNFAPPVNEFNSGMDIDVPTSHAGIRTNNHSDTTAYWESHQSSPPPPPPPPPPAPSNLAFSSSSTISAAPVRYSAPPTTNDLNANPPDIQSIQEDPSTARAMSTGKDFARRLLKKYGWKEGHGLGAQNDGITTILRHQTSSKRKKRPDAEGGGWIGPAGGIGKIVGGKRRKTENEDEGQEGDVLEEEGAQTGYGKEKDADGREWSVVAHFQGLLGNIEDVQHEMSEGTLMQDIGEKMGEYGIVERLYVDINGQENKDIGPSVFVKWTSPLSAYRAIQAANTKNGFFATKARLKGNRLDVTVKARFYDVDKFDGGNYEK